MVAAVWDAELGDSQFADHPALDNFLAAADGRFPRLTEHKADDCPWSGNPERLSNLLLLMIRWSQYETVQEWITHERQSNSGMSGEPGVGVKRSHAPTPFGIDTSLITLYRPWGRSNKVTNCQPEW